MEEKVRRRFSAEKKVQILREQLKNRVPISELSRTYNIHPTQFYAGEKALGGGLDVAYFRNPICPIPVEPIQKTL